MAASEVARGRRGFTLLEMLTAVAVIAVLLALGVNAFTTGTRNSRVTGEARRLVRQLQAARTRAVAEGNAQGFLVGPIANASADPNGNQTLTFVKPLPTATPVTYANGVDRVRDQTWLPRAGPNPLLELTGNGIAQPTAFSVGFDINGQPTIATYDAAYAPTLVTPAVWPYCLRIRDQVEQSLRRYVILFNDGTVKVQRDETYCFF
ncbi:MAG TPA: prepilin-type N-terminal cleavage/methylation domain-containing protein [Myxococcaceae bacterium]|nr:prepilin-type N-terminal cleavage/methylation domain-containing protein [Myxococcaceae bacterium]